MARDFDERRGGDGSQLETFLEESCLVNDTDDWERDFDRVTLMTLHSSKGLEFPVVYITAVEEGILPHERSRDLPDELEEERRLLFVGITRAQKELQISMSQYRDYRGQRKMTVPSSFLLELPRHEMKVENFGTDDTGESSSSLVHDDFSGMEERQEQYDEPVAQRLDWAETTGNAAAPQSAGAIEASDGGATVSERVSPDDFAQGALVRHPKYGLGRIVALSGVGVCARPL